MGAYSVAITALFLGLLGVATSQEDCTTTGFKLGNPRCPSGTREVFREEAFGQKIKFCCRPGTLDEANYNKVARRCRVTRCAQPTANPCSSLYTRVYNGETLTYEEVSRDTCTTSGGTNGVSAYCCRRNSTEGLLATTYGAEKNEFPHIALLNLGGGQCGGTIYNKRYIITAAHCIVGETSHLPREPDATWIAKLGRNIGSLEMPENDYVIEAATPHEDYSLLLGSPELEQESPEFYNDVALLRLNRDITFGPNVKSIKIAPQGFNELQYADKAVIIGWGTTDTLDVSDNLQKANFVIRRDRTCFAHTNETPWPWQFNRTEQLLCVGGIREGIWSPTAGGGDSGGPAVCRGEDGLAVLCGVTSYGGNDTLCAANNDETYCPPSVYAEVDNFREWIVENAGDQDENTFYNVPLFGEQPPRNRREHQVHITSDEGKACGGTLIAADTVVTAAQCVAVGDDSGTMYNGLTVTSGINNLRSSKGKQHEVKGVVVLEGFKRNGKKIDEKQQGNRVRITDRYHTNDLAVIKLEKGVVGMKSSAFPKLPEFDEGPSNPAYELAFPRKTNREGALQQRQFTILDKAECQRRMNRMERVNMKLEVDENILCGVEKYSGGSTCDRELGGGLICKGRNGKETLCGVQVFRLCEWSIPNGFVNMALYSDWVEDVRNML